MSDDKNGQRPSEGQICGTPGPLNSLACQRPMGHDGDHQSSEREVRSSWPRTPEDRASLIEARQAQIAATYGETFRRLADGPPTPKAVPQPDDGVFYVRRLAGGGEVIACHGRDGVSFTAQRLDNASPELRDLARKAVAANEARRGEDVDAWAAQLAADSCAMGDEPVVHLPTKAIPRIDAHGPSLETIAENVADYASMGASRSDLRDRLHRLLATRHESASPSHVDRAEPVHGPSTVDPASGYDAGLMTAERIVRERAKHNADRSKGPSDVRGLLAGALYDAADQIGQAVFARPPPAETVLPSEERIRHFIHTWCESTSHEAYMRRDLQELFGAPPEKGAEK